MDAFKISVKLFAERDTFKPDEFIPVFHHWIQEQAFEGHLLIDVADYAHVTAGPGTVLIAREANIQSDRAENRLGVLYSRKLASPGTFSDRLHVAITEALKAAVKLEQEPLLSGRLKFRSDEILIRINDRLLAPNTDETLATVKADIESAAAEIFDGQPFSLSHNIGRQSLFEVRIKSQETGPISKLLERTAARV